MDLFGNLPDELLCHILSFLPTKNAALTSVLSKRWLNLFALVPNLNIDDSVFLPPGGQGELKREMLRQSFMDFVDRVLALQGDSPIKKFSLKCTTLVDSDRLDSWISNVLARGVVDLDLTIWAHGDFYELSPKVYKSRNLVKLKIGFGGIHWLAGSIFLPMLKTLILAWDLIHSTFDIPLRALPALEELVLVGVRWTAKDVILSSASLKSLTIDSNYCSNSLSLDTPGLVYFVYNGCVVSDFPVVNMKNLVDARIDFCLTENKFKLPGSLFGGEDALAISNVGKLFHGIRHVSYLYLSPNTLELLSLCCEPMQVFNNLKVLRIESHKEREWQAMPVLLRNCPTLETLVLEGLLHYETNKCGDACDCISREDKGRSLTSCPVKKIQIKRFRGRKRELGMIKHFLNYFPCLEEMKIYVDPTKHRNAKVSELIEELKKLYNKLSGCNVQVLLS